MDFSKTSLAKKRETWLRKMEKKVCGMQKRCFEVVKDGLWAGQKASFIVSKATNDAVWEGEWWGCSIEQRKRQIYAWILGRFGLIIMLLTELQHQFPTLLWLRVQPIDTTHRRSFNNRVGVFGITQKELGDIGMNILEGNGREQRIVRIVHMTREFLYRNPRAACLGENLEYLLVVFHSIWVMGVKKQKGELKSKRPSALLSRIL